MIRLLKSKLEDATQIREKPILSELTFLLKLNLTYLEKLKMHKTLSGYLSLPMSSKAEFKYLHFSWNYMLDRSAKFNCRNLFESPFCFNLFESPQKWLSTMHCVKKNYWFSCDLILSFIFSMRNVKRPKQLLVVDWITNEKSLN
jgi:hypothetical protein